MPLIIKNIQRVDDQNCLYSVQINDQPVLAQFVHNRSQGVSKCLRAAAQAVDGGKLSPDFIAGVQWAINQMQDDAHSLSEIRDTYIESQKTGVHGGRRITPEFAKVSARNFHERSDAVYLAADYIEKLLQKKQFRPLVKS